MLKLTARQTAKVLKVISSRYSAEQTKSMSRAEFNALIDSVAQELFSK